MCDVVIVSIVRMFIGCVYKGVLNNLFVLLLGGYVIVNVVVKVGIELVSVDDVIMGVVLM